MQRVRKFPSAPARFPVGRVKAEAVARPGERVQFEVAGRTYMAWPSPSGKGWDSMVAWFPVRLPGAVPYHVRGEGRGRTCLAAMRNAHADYVGAVASA